MRENTNLTMIIEIIEENIRKEIHGLSMIATCLETGESYEVYSSNRPNMYDMYLQNNVVGFYMNEDEMIEQGETNFTVTRIENSKTKIDFTLYTKEYYEAMNKKSEDRAHTLTPLMV